MIVFLFRTSFFSPWSGAAVDYIDFAQVLVN